MQTSDYEEMIKRVAAIHDIKEDVIADTVAERRAWVAAAVTTSWNDLPSDEVIMKDAWDGVILDMAKRGKDPRKDKKIIKVRKTDPELAADMVASIMADRVKHNMATKDLAGELRKKNQKQHLLKMKKLQLYPGYQTRVAWSCMQKSRAE